MMQERLAKGLDGQAGAALCNKGLVYRPLKAYIRGQSYQPQGRKIGVVAKQLPRRIVSDDNRPAIQALDRKSVV